MKVKNLFTLVLTVLFGASMTLSAQVTPQTQQKKQSTDFSEETLKEFVAASQDINTIQKEGQAEMTKTIKDEGLDMKTYREISSAQRNPKKDPQASDKEMDSYKKANKKVKKVRTNMQKDMQKAIGNHDITIQEYRKVMQAYRSNPQLKKKIDDMMAQSQ